MEEKIALVTVFISSVLLASFFILPFDQLLGEDPYFHRDVTEFLVDHQSLPQNNLEEWSGEKPYAAYLTFKLKTYPQGFYFILYPFHKILRFFSIFFSGLISISIYLFLSKYSKEAGILGGILVHTPNFTAHSILLLPETIGLISIPFILYLFERKYYLSGILLGLLLYIHPFSAVIGCFGLIIMGGFKKEFKNLGIALGLSVLIALPYIALIMGEKINVGYQLGVHLSLEIYTLKEYVKFFGILIVSPLFFYLSWKKKDYLSLIILSFLIVLSVVRVTRVPTERFFAYLSIFLAIIVAKRVVEINHLKIKYALIFSLIVISFAQNYWIFGAIGPSTREVESWEFLNESSLEEATVLGWDRYPQIFTVRREIFFSKEAYKDYKGFDYVSPDANVLVYKRAFLNSLKEDKIYDNKVGLWHIDDS
ncbi:MAG: hypothetical protein U9N35_00055 [Euryarchaeota archaeon]|nr:hypothetical protein [Euryarchaeota archaeon]